MSDQPLSLQWLCFIRDHGLDLKVTLGERALASLLPTYGQGKNIFVSMHKLAEKTGWSRNTVKKHRNGLIAKGLLEDITGDPDKQSRTYRLTMPGYVGQNLTPLGQNLTPPGSKSDHNIKPEIEKETKHNINTTPGEARDGVVVGGRNQSQNQAPAGADEEPQTMDWDDPDDGGALAEALGVPLGSIGKPFRAWLDGLVRSGDLDLGGDYTALHYAVKDSAGKRNPVGYLQTILPGYVSELRDIGKARFYAKHRGDG